MSVHRWRGISALIPLLALLAFLLPQPMAQANHIAAPTSVTLAGSLQSELGCSSDWDPACATTHLTNIGNGVFRGEFTVPAGDWEYKVALNNSWDVNYGANATPGGANIQLDLAAPATVRFYYDHKTHTIFDSVNSKVPVVAGLFQSELGCPGDWQPSCVRTLMTDPDGDGTFTFITTAIPIGTYAFKVALNENWTTSFPGSDVPFEVTKANQEVFFSYNATTNAVVVSVAGAPKGSLVTAKAHWLTRDTIAWNIDPAPATVNLVYSANAGLTLDPTGILNGQSLTLTYDAAGLSADLKAKYPHLAGYKVFKLAAADVAAVPAILKGQIGVEARNAASELVDATALQIYGVLDELYTYNGELGLLANNPSLPTVPAVYGVRLWAPTARSVKLHIFDNATTPISTTREMAFDATTGVWAAPLTEADQNKYYLYGIEVFTRATNKIENNLVSDPYSLNLSINSARSQIVNMNDPALKPAGWEMTPKPTLEAPEDIVLYELHVRDFSVNDPSVPEVMRGTFKAFTEQNSNGMRHLQALARAGLTHIHLLPAFDCASINEDKSTWQQPDPAKLNSAPDSDQQQMATTAVADADGFNWCYDPFHYTVPEGSYSTNPNDTTRILEFREMVQALNRSGLRVVMDVVYNHTASSGQSDKSVLDKIVPGYYHRLNAEGNVETSTCCQNTASEHNMMRKLMIDSLVTWARDYKVDGFRFDLMGHHMKVDMEQARDALQALTPAKDGVRGSDIYIYGEGWDFGEVAKNARGVNATQLNMAGTGIGTFNDRIRDAVRGGGPFDDAQDILKNQGFATGLFYDPNDVNKGASGLTVEQQKNRMLLYQDQIRVSLAGNLKDFQFIGRTGVITTGAGVEYNGSPAGYTSDPQEIINYVEAHDNMTLFDAVQLKASSTATITDRVRMDQIANDIVALSQGVPFFQAAQDLLRSKSFDENSYNSGDWFNRIDWTYNTNNFGVGLPPTGTDNWPIYKPLLANPALKPSRTLIEASTLHFQEMLRIRKSSPLFRLRTAEQVQNQLSFLNTGPDQTPGVIVMQLSEPRSLHIGNPFKRVVVVFNATTTTQTFSADTLKGAKLQLHPVQRASADSVTRTSSFDAATGTLTVPARTTAVFVHIESQQALTFMLRK